MKKASYIAWKDIRIRLADRSAFIFLLLTPMILTLILGAAFGGLGGGSSGPSAIPVAVSNMDNSEFGQALVDLLTSEDLSDLLDVQLCETEAAARFMVDEEDFAAAVIIPTGFTDMIMPGGLSLAEGMGMLRGGLQQETANIAVYANPAQPISSNIVKSIVEAFGWQVSSNVVGGAVSVQQLLALGTLGPAGIMAYVQNMAERLREKAQAGDENEAGFQQLITLRQQSIASEEAGSGTEWIIAYYAPSMAIMFLSFGVTQGARTILAEQRTGTLDRLRATPTSAVSILGGKLVSTFVMGLLQFAILIGFSSAIFGLTWGEPLAVALLSLVLVGAMTSLGIVLAALVRSEEQVNTFGMAVLLVFSAISGNFVPRVGFPDWLRTAGLITPNAWALEGFTKLGTGGGLGDIGGELLALTIMTAVLFGVGVIRFRRRMTV